MNTCGRHFPKSVILTAVRWYLTYPLSYRQVEELLTERGIRVDHTTVHRWVVKYSPMLLDQFKRQHRNIGKSWRMDETYLTGVSGRGCGGTVASRKGMPLSASMPSTYRRCL